MQISRGNMLVLIKSSGPRDQPGVALEFSLSVMVFFGRKDLKVLQFFWASRIRRLRNRHDDCCRNRPDICNLSRAVIIVAKAS